MRISATITRGPLQSIRWQMEVNRRITPGGAAGRRTPSRQGILAEYPWLPDSSALDLTWRTVPPPFGDRAFLGYQRAWMSSNTLRWRAFVHQQAASTSWRSQGCLIEEAERRARRPSSTTGTAVGSARREVSSCRKQASITRNIEGGSPRRGPLPRGIEEAEASPGWCRRWVGSPSRPAATAPGR